MQHSSISLAGKEVINIEGSPKSLDGVSPIKLKGREVIITAKLDTKFNTEEWCKDYFQFQIHHLGS